MRLRKKSRHIGSFRWKPREWLMRIVSGSAGHGVARQALPPPFGRWADAPPLRCGLSPKATGRAGPRHRGSLFFFSLPAPQAPVSHAVKVILCSASFAWETDGVTTAALLDLERPSVASSSSRPLAPARCSARRAASLTSSLSLSAIGARRSGNTRSRVRDHGLRPHRAPRPSSPQVMSGANYDRNRKWCRATVFTQTDPLQADIGSPYPSAYVYGNNNPLVFTDPSGLRGQAAQGSANPVREGGPEAPNELALAAVAAVKGPFHFGYIAVQRGDDDEIEAVDVGAFGSSTNRRHRPWFSIELRVNGVPELFLGAIQYIGQARGSDSWAVNDVKECEAGTWELTVRSWLPDRRRGIPSVVVRKIDRCREPEPILKPRVPAQIEKEKNKKKTGPVVTFPRPEPVLVF